MHSTKHLPNACNLMVLKHLALALSAGLWCGQLNASEVNIYSARQPFLIQPILDEFSEQTGIVTNIVYIKRGLIARMQREGRKSSADLILSTDIAPLVEMAALNVTQAVNSKLLQKNIPARYRAPDKTWFGLTSRARVIYAAKERVSLTSITDYESLTATALKGKVCSRSAKHNYMLSLISSIIHAKGKVYTKQWLLGVKKNLARKPQGNDRAQVKAIKEGVCDVALVNSYYYGKMLNNLRKPEQVSWANAVNLIFPNQNNRGTHMNISGMALKRNAPHPEEAIALMEYLSGAQAQYSYTEKNYEFPINPVTPTSLSLNIYPRYFKEDQASLAEITKYRRQAIELVNQTKFDE